jgi:hypothetical protein
MPQIAHPVAGSGSPFPAGTDARKAAEEGRCGTVCLHPLALLPSSRREPFSQEVPMSTFTGYGLLFVLLLSGCAGTGTTRIIEYGSPVSQTDLAEKDRIVETINQLFIGTDQKDWQKVKGLFAPVVHFDMTSLAGGAPVTMTPQQIVDAWDKGLKPLKAVHHQAGNYIVTVSGSEADAFCYGIASHYLPTKSGRNTRTFVGSYDFHLVKKDGVWWIDRFKFNLKYLDGNPDLEKDQ